MTSWQLKGRWGEPELHLADSRQHPGPLSQDRACCTHTEGSDFPICGQIARESGPGELGSERELGISGSLVPATGEPKTRPGARPRVSFGCRATTSTQLEAAGEPPSDSADRPAGATARPSGDSDTGSSSYWGLPVARSGQVQVYYYSAEV